MKYIIKEAEDTKQLNAQIAAIVQILRKYKQNESAEDISKNTELDESLRKLSLQELEQKYKELNKKLKQSQSQKNTQQNTSNKQTQTGSQIQQQKQKQSTPDKSNDTTQNKSNKQQAQQTAKDEKSASSNNFVQLLKDTGWTKDKNILTKQDKKYIFKLSGKDIRALAFQNVAYSSKFMQVFSNIINEAIESYQFKLTIIDKKTNSPIVKNKNIIVPVNTSKTKLNSTLRQFLPKQEKISAKNTKDANTQNNQEDTKKVQQQKQSEQKKRNTQKKPVSKRDMKMISSIIDSLSEEQVEALQHKYSILDTYKI